MQHFYFKKITCNYKTKYIWQSQDMKLVFSDASFQAFDDCAYVKDVNNILYLYYDVDIYSHSYIYNKNGKECKNWNKVASVKTYDFPTILQLQSMLNKMLNEEIALEDCRKINYYAHNEFDSIGYEYICRTEGFFCDDHYQITRILRKKEGISDNISYMFYAGASIDSQGSISSIGMTTYSTEEGMKKLLECVNTFIKDTIDKHNENVREYNKENINTYMKFGENRMLCTKKGDEAIFTINEKLNSITTIENDLDSNDFYSEKYKNVQIKSIDEDGIVICNGYLCKGDENFIKDIEKNVKISYKKIISVYNEIDDTVLHYNEMQIIEDFINNILTDFELEEFEKNDLKYLYDKWGNIIIDRYWMFRTEHNFETFIKEKDMEENVHNAIEFILNGIKEYKKK